MKKTYYYYFLFAFIISYNAIAQESNFIHFGLDQGLSQESVQTIIKDKDGFVWIGTQDGLNRFDGSSFKIFKTDFENPNSLCSNDIKHLVALDNYIVIGSKNNGICIYNKKTNSFQKTTITDGICTSLIKHKGDVYFIIENKGLFKLTITNEVKIKKITNSLHIKSLSVAYSDGNYLYFGNNNGIIYYTNNLNNNEFNQIDLPNKSILIKSFYKENNKLWIGTNNGLFAYNFDVKEIQPIAILKKVKKIIINKITKLDDVFYIGTNYGLYKLNNFNHTKKQFDNVVVFNGDKDTQSSITSNRVYDLLYDNHILWIGTNKLDGLNLNKTVFKSINTKTKPSLNNNHVYAIYKTEDYTFIGTRLGLNCVNNKTNLTSIINVNNTNGKLANNVIRDINLDANNNLWLATTKGVSIIDLDNFKPENPKISTFYHQKNNKNSLSSDITRTVFIDLANNIWISTYGGGINLLVDKNDFENPKFIHFKNDKAVNSLSSNLVFCINQTKNKTYWIGTENGLCKMTFDNDNYLKPKFKTFKKDLSNNKTLKSNSILTIYNDKYSDDILWIGTENGLHKFDIDTEEFTHYGLKNGLTNSVIYSILEDFNDLLWVSTNTGLFQFNKQLERFVNYSKSDGLDNTEFNLGAKFKDFNKQLLYFGGTKGVNYFNVKDFESFKHEGNLFFTELRIKNIEINPNSNGIINDNIINSPQINLKYNDFPATLKFSDLSFNIPNNYNFVYKLLPKDTEWNSINNLNEIQLLNLNNGTYTLEIQGQGKTYLWNKKPLSIQLIVSPPWYKTKLAYLLYFLSFFALIIMFYRIQLAKKLEHQEVARLKDLNNLKTKLYANITHEFRTPITVILGMSQNIKEKLKNSSIDVTNSIDLIENNSNGLLNLVNQILDLAKLEKGKLKLNLEQGNIITHIKYVTESFKSFAEENKIELVFYDEIKEVLMDFDADKITQILKNLISNAIKFCNENDKIIVHTKVKNDSTLIVKIQDTGIGISPSNLPFIFDRFYQAENNSNSSYQGTGIGLALTKDLINLMNGNIAVLSTPNQGTTFKITLPIIKDVNTSKATVKKVLIPKKHVPSLKNNKTLIKDGLPIVLIVEDNPDVATYIHACVEDSYQIIYAKNGQEGINFAIKHIPDIIISDVMMPLVDGFELCNTLKNDIKTNHIPIILLTAKATQESKISGLSLGADAYLTKPFNKEELLIRIEKLINLRKILQNKYANIDLLVTDKSNKSNTQSDEFINKIIEKIHLNLDDNNFASNELAASLFMSSSQLYRKIKALTNTSTAIFIRRIRLQKAKELLEVTNDSVSEIAYQTGFVDPSWFSKCFKKEFGYSPSKPK